MKRRRDRRFPQVASTVAAIDMNFQLENGWPLVACVALAAAWRAYASREASAAAQPMFPSVSRRMFAAMVGVIAGIAASALWIIGGSYAPAVLLLGAIACGVDLATRWYQWNWADSLARERKRMGSLRAIAWVLALTMIAQPSCSRRVTDWERPLLVVVLDQSNSMKTVDYGAAAARADVANARFANAKSQLSSLEEQYEVRIRDLAGAAAEWKISPNATTSPIAAALRTALEMRSSAGDPPVALLLVSDGGSAGAADEQRAGLGAEMARRRIGLFAAGVGPGALGAPGIEIERFDAPAKVAPGDRFMATLRGQARNLAGKKLRISLEWEDEEIVAKSIDVASADVPIQESFELRAPRAGLLRLTLQVSPEAAGAAEALTRSVMIDARRDPIRVSWIESRSRPEQTFAVRALRGDTDIEVTIVEPRNGTGVDWSGQDVIVVGEIGEGTPRNVQEVIATACRDSGVGVLLAGGVNGFSNLGESLAEICPLRLHDTGAAREASVRFVPTKRGLAHPIFAGLDPDAAPDPRREVVVRGDERAWGIWATLSALGGAATLGKPKSLAETLAVDENGEALLATQEVGRGRVAVACWSGVWPWALGSDAGADLHRRFWRQTIRWLANRRPQPWIATDEAVYSLGLVAAGQQMIQIRAGVVGETPNRAAGDLVTSATLRRVESPTATSASASQSTASSEASKIVHLRRREGEWVAEAPRDVEAQGALTTGTYELTVSFRPPTGAASRPAEAEFVARTRFDIEDADLEMRQPNANLTFLRELATATAGVGGAYREINDFSALLENLRGSDRRRKVERWVEIGPAARWPWVLLFGMAAAFAVEWVLRRRNGLA